MGTAERNIPAFLYIFVYNMVMIAFWGSVAADTWPLAKAMWQSPESPPPDVWRASGHMVRIAVGKSTWHQGWLLGVSGEDGWRSKWWSPEI